VPYPPPASLSPSKISTFTNCPLSFRFRVIEHRPEPPTVPAVRGTLVHAALERLIWHHAPGARDRAAAAAALASAWEDLEDHPEVVGLGLDGAGADALYRTAEELVGKYFSLEDPNAVRAVGFELGLEAQLDDVRLRGIIDRLDVRDDGELVVVDYKTGRAPSARFERDRKTGVHLYALLCDEVLGRPPAEVRLLYLADPVTITAHTTAQTLRGQRTRTAAVWSAVRTSCAREDFRPRPSPLCSYCAFQDLCPAQGGELPDPAGAASRW